MNKEEIEKLQQPKFIRYTVQCPNGSAPRKGMDFYTCDSILLVSLNGTRDENILIFL